MSHYTYDLQPLTGPALGLIVLQTDERIEQDFARLIPAGTKFHISRLPSEPDVTPSALATMEAHISATARLLPGAVDFDVIGYGCTSGTAQIGAGRVHELVQQGTDNRTRTVSDPLTALIAACNELGLMRLAFLSPYVESVSDRLRGTLGAQGIETPVFGTFNEAEESRVVRIAPQSIFDVAQAMVQQGGCDGIFLSCTNLNTLDIIAPLQAATGLPVLSSNLVLAWHMCRCAGLSADMDIGIRSGREVL
jgi:maleate isomerase